MNTLVKASQTSLSTRGWVVGGTGFIADVLSILDIFDQMPDMDDVADDVYEHWQEEMDYLNQILDGQLDIKDQLNDIMGMLEDGQEISQGIQDSLETGLNDINAQIDGVKEEIEEMQVAILQSMSIFYEAVMVQFEIIRQQQKYVISQLKVIEEMLMALAEQMSQLSAKVDWGGVVTLAGPHLQRIDYLFNCMYQMPTVDNSGAKAGDVDVTEINYFRLRDWAKSVMDYNTGMPLALDAVHQLIMGENMLVASIIQLQIKLLQEGAFPTGGHSKAQVVQDYYNNLVYAQVKGFMCVEAACQILQIKNPFDGLINVRITKQLQLVTELLDQSGFDNAELLPAPKVGERKQEYWGDASNVETLTIDLLDPGMELTDPHEWVIVNFMPFPEGANAGHIEVCLAKLKPNFQVDTDTYVWKEIVTADTTPLKMTNVARLINSAGYIQTATVSCPEDRIPTAYVLELDVDVLRIKLIHNAYDPAGSVWQDDPQTSEIVFDTASPGALDQNFLKVIEGSIGYWPDSPVAVASDIPIMTIGFLPSVEDSMRTISFQTSRCSIENASNGGTEIIEPEVSELIESPQENSLYIRCSFPNNIYEHKTVFHIKDVKPSSFSEWTIVNIKPLSSEEGVLSVCIGKLLPNYEIDSSTIEWINVVPQTAGAAFIWDKDALDEYNNGGVRFNVSDIEVPVGRVAVGFTFKLSESSSAYHSCSIQHCDYNMATGIWDDSTELTETGQGTSEYVVEPNIPGANPDSYSVYLDEPVFPDDNYALAMFKFQVKGSYLSYAGKKFIPGTQ
ncbi:hypothetical protein [Sessilibacter corallicola]|uniref:Uncharacterized protein n=1 Tax=Sessilibacter corallicola TaxID=2904075 RepID=A0ABQ0ABJ7_9GAMM